MERMKLYLGDCLELMRDLPDKSIDLILCDLPYGTTACKWDVIIPFAPLWEQYKRIIKDDGCIALFCCQPFTTLLIQSNFDWFKYCWIWEKPQGVDPFMAKVRPLNNYEEIAIFGKKVRYFPQMAAGSPYHMVRDKKPRVLETKGVQMKPTETINTGTRYPTRVLRFNQDSEKLHPTQKPVALCEYLIRTYTREGDTVLDNCMGSGTTGVAALNTGRFFIGMEKDEQYFKLAQERLNKVRLAQKLKGVNE